MNRGNMEPTSRSDAYMMMARLAQNLCNEVDYTEALKESVQRLKKDNAELGSQLETAYEEIDELRKQLAEYKLDNENLYNEMAQYRQNWLDLLAKYEPETYKKYIEDPDKTGWIV